MTSETAVPIHQCCVCWHITVLLCEVYPSLLLHEIYIQNSLFGHSSIPTYITVTSINLTITILFPSSIILQHLYIIIMSMTYVYPCI